MSVRDDLHQALEQEHAVRLRRRIAGSDEVRGIPVALGRKWALFVRVDDGVIVNGYEAVRVADLTRVRPEEHQAFTRRAVAHNGGLPPALDLPLDRTRDLVDTLAGRFPLLGLHVERDRPDVLHIGRPVGWERRHVVLHEIAPGGTWRKRATCWWPGDLTRFTVGDVYLEALALQAAERPVPRPVRWST